MNMKNIFGSTLLLLLCAALVLVGTVGCSAPLEDDENPPAQMQNATIAGAPYRLFLPADWNLTVDAGVSGGYYSMNDAAKISAELYDNADGLSETEFWSTVMQPQLKDTFGGELEVEKDDPIKTTLGTVFNDVNYAVEAQAVRYSGILGHIVYKGMAVIAPFGGQMLVLTYLAQEDVYETYLDGMEAAVLNFRWLGRPYEPSEPTHTVDPDAEAPAGMKLASNDDVAYRFYVPESWVLNTALPTSSAYVSESDRSNVMVTVYMPEEDTLTAEQYWEMCLAELQGEDEKESVIRNLEVLSDTEGELDGRPSHTYVYRGDVNGKTYRFSQTIAAYRGMVYTLTYTAQDTVFESHLDAVTQMIEAFDFRGN